MDTRKKHLSEAHTHLCMFNDDLRCYWNKKDTSVCGKESKGKKKWSKLASYQWLCSRMEGGERKKYKYRWVSGKKKCLASKGWQEVNVLEKGWRQKNLWSVMFTIWSGCYSEARADDKKQHLHVSSWISLNCLFLVVLTHTQQGTSTITEAQHKNW